MSGTNYSTTTSRRLTWSDASYRRRLVIFALSLAIGIFLITWGKVSIWNQMAQLRHELSVPASDAPFHDTLQLAIAHLDLFLNDYCAHPQVAARDGFRKEAKVLHDSLNRYRSTMQTPGEQESFANIESRWSQYVDGAEDFFRMKEPRAKDLAQMCQSIREKSLQLRLAISDLSSAQFANSSNSFRQSQRTLYRLESLLKLLLLFQWVLALFLAVLGYRGMIAPLRHRLSQSEALVARQEKLASLGVLAAGVAHEIRNPLTAIKFRLFSLKNSLPEIAKNEHARVVNSEINRLDRIVKDFLQFARPSDPQLTNTPVERVVQQVGELMQPNLEKSGIDLRIDSPRDLWINADPQQIEQVLINLVQNAADSIGDHGTITLQAKEARAELNGKLESAVIVAVTDTGKGISPEVEKRLFDPFFSTKKGGTGLGLAIAARIIEKHGGVLRYNRKLDQGATFEIVLPRLNSHAFETPAH